MKAILTITLSFLLSLSSLAQCADSDKILFPVKEQISESLVFFAVNDEYGSVKHYASSISEYANKAMAVSKNYIVQRSGAAFEKKCRVKYLYVRYPDGMNEDSVASDLYNISDHKVLYIIAYVMKQGGFDYNFDVVVGNDFNLISGDVLPSAKSNPSFDKFIDVCKALKTVKADKRYKGTISGIGIAYHADSDSFCWQVQEHPASVKEEGEYPVRDYYVNANTGKLVNVVESKSYFFP
jgi:predicted small secreted protein